MIRIAARIASVAALSLGAAVVLSDSSSVAVDAPSGPQSVAFECTGAAQNWVVPLGVTSATFDAFGAQGGIGDDGQLDRPSSAAGLGGHTTATIPVTAGETIQINVGCAGSNSLGASAPGGFGGSPGGNGGVGGDLGTGGGGGGSSDARQGGVALTNRVVVAGGGGGSGGANGVAPTDVSAAAGTDGAGGGGGGTAGVAGNDTANAGGGGGGTQAANGAGGATGTCTSTGVVGGAGTDVKGGDGGTHPTFGAGGGGGGGFLGGGGGAGCVNGGGGGGGAGFAMVGATGVANETGVRSGNGRVVVTFTVVIAQVVQIQPVFTG